MNDEIFDLAYDLFELLLDRKMILTTAESCTGGLLSAAITRISGSSQVFETGFVTYSNLAKTTLLGVTPARLDHNGAVSIEVAHDMVLGALEAAKADLALSITGVAGPLGGTIEKPVGTVCFGLAIRNLDNRINIITERKLFQNLDRDGVRNASTAHALHLALSHLMA